MGRLGSHPVRIGSHPTVSAKTGPQQARNKQRASEALFGRQIAYVMLLHDTRLNADCIDDLAAILKRRHLKGVTLEEAMMDPAYRNGDPYVGRNGIDWIERWSNVLHKNLPWDSWQDVPKSIEEEYDRNNKDRHWDRGK